MFKRMQTTSLMSPLMSALVAIAFFATATEHELSPWAALAIALSAAVGMHYIYVKLEEMECEYEKRRRRRCRGKNVQFAADGGRCQTRHVTGNTYACYVPGNTDKPVRLSDTKDVRSTSDTATRSPIRKVCGVLSYDYYTSEDKERWI